MLLCLVSFDFFRGQWLLLTYVICWGWLCLTCLYWIVKSNYRYYSVESHASLSLFVFSVLSRGVTIATKILTSYATWISSMSKFLPAVHPHWLPSEHTSVVSVVQGTTPTIKNWRSTHLLRSVVHHSSNCMVTSTTTPWLHCIVKIWERTIVYLTWSKWDNLELALGGKNENINDWKK